MCEWPKTTASPSGKRAEALEAAACGAGVVDHADARALGLDDAALGQPRASAGASTLPSTATPAGRALELVEHRGGRDVAGVEDQVGAAQALEAAAGRRRARAAGACRR